MNSRYRHHILAVVLLAVGGASTEPLFAEEATPAPKAANAEVRVQWETNTLVYSQAEWVLRIQYLNKGTRSEGQDGVLLKNGQEVKPSKDGEVLDTALGQVKHYGTERKLLWDLTGWNFADKKRIKLSNLVKVPSPEPTK